MLSPAHTPATITRPIPAWMPAALAAALRDCGGRPLPVRFSAAERRVLRKRKKIPISQWAEFHRVVTMTALPGPWKNSVTPYLIGIMDAIDFPSVQRLSLCKCVQSGGSESVHNMVGSWADQAPGPVMYVYPDEQTGRENAKDRIIPMFRSSARLKTLLTGAQDDEGALRINLQHMPIYIAWARSASRLGNRPIRYLVKDEVNKYPATAGKDEADPGSLADKRTTTFRHNKKIVELSTPTIETGNITLAMNAAQVIFDFWVKCPVCGTCQVMRFDRMDGYAETDDPGQVEAAQSVRYRCEGCDARWDDAARDRAVRSGQWRARTTRPLELFAYLNAYRPRHIAFHLPAWVSPFVSLSEGVAAYLRGLSDPSKMQDWCNNYAAEPFKQVVSEATSATILKARCELEPQMVPAEALALTCFVDVQKYGFWYAVRAFAADYTSWLIQYGNLGTWTDVEGLLFGSTWPTVGNPDRRHPIWRAAVDTGGGKKEGDLTMTEETYWWVRKNGTGRGCRVYAARGSSRPLAGKIHVGKPLDKTPAGKPIPGGLQLIFLDPDKWKDTVHYRLAQAADKGAYAAYLNKDTGEDYAKQILAEEKRRDKKGIETWERIRKDNHLLDCECGCHALADPEWPGGGINILAHLQQAIASTPDDSAHGPARSDQKEATRGDGGSWLHTRGYQRPGWLNR